MKNNLLTLCFVFLSFLLNAQENDYLSIGFESNSQYYMDDSKTGDFVAPNRFRSNNYLTVEYGYKNFYAGLQVESYSPMALLNYYPGFEKTNLGLYYAGYKSEKINLTVGHFYEQFGSGLIFRTWENRQLGINNALRGARVKYFPTDYIDVTAVFGQQRAGFKYSDGTVFGFDSNIDLSQLLSFENSNLVFGVSYLGRNQKNEILTPKFNSLTNSFSGRVDFSSGNFYSNAEYVTKGEDAIYVFGNVRNAKKGNSFLLNLGYAKKGLGIDVTLRRMENANFYSERDAVKENFNQNIINYIPGLTKQHDYLLTNIYVYQAQPQISFIDPTLVKLGEIGGQMDLYYKIKKKTLLGGKYGTKIAVNASYWAGLKGDVDFNNFDYDTSLLGFGEKYFSEVSLEVRKKWSKKWSSIFYYVNQYYNKRFIEEQAGEVRADILVGESTFKIGNGKSIRFEAQHLWTKDDRKNWTGGTVEFNTSSNLAFYVSDIYNYGSTDVSKKIHYYNLGGSYTYKSHRFALNYGRQRGGLVCVGGVCRNVPESTGVTVNISMSF
ncbi:DUF6029 family protein [Tenacibaculum halocynthiae]|uniref:DUF6029 family protein n=1 Tax=Tenacibaculum halocynthiae TaxID=1254437 RepID=UPI003892DE43